MTGRRAVTGTCVLCALAFSVMAQSAVAKNGTTMFTCKENPAGGKDFLKAHCKSKDFSPGNGKYEHVEVKQDAKTALHLTNAGNGPDTNASVTTALKSTISGVEFELQAEEVSGEGTLTNSIEAGEQPVEHKVTGIEVIKHKKAKMVKPKESGCSVKSEEIVSNELEFTTAGQEMGMKIQPASGTVIETFELTGCTIGALNGKYELTGSFNVIPDGATLEFTEGVVTEAGTLKLRGQKAGLEGSTTISGKDPAVDNKFTPVSFTTVITK